MNNKIHIPDFGASQSPSFTGEGEGSIKRNVAVVWGGYSSEAVISAKSMKGICSFLDKSRYTIYALEITRQHWMVDTGHGKYEVDKNDFSFFDKHNNQSVKFDFAYITIHGTPGEDGHVQGYLDMLGVPYSTCGLMASALTFNKYICNKFLKNFDIHVADSMVLHQRQSCQLSDIVSQLGLPLFVKPCIGGSSFATSKVKTADQLQTAIDKAFGEANEVIIETYIKGREITCGCYKVKNKEVVLPITEVITSNEFFDYEAKYEGKVQEITPADLTDQMTAQIQELTLRIYHLVGAKGMIRADYIIDGDTPYLLEVNTTPGMTDTSFIPQQVKAAGLNMTDVLTEIIEDYYLNITEKSNIE